MVFIRGEEESLAGGEGGAIHGAGAGGAGDREPAAAARGRAAERRAELEERRREVRALHDLHGSVRASHIMRPVFVVDIVVDSVLGQLGVELAGLAVQTWAVVVIDAVGDVRSLLDFSQIASAADGVDAAGRDEEYVAGRDHMVAQDVDDRPVLHATRIFLRRQWLRQAGVQMRPLGRADDVPHLVLAMSAMSFPRKFIAGMDLDAQVLPGVDELYQ